MAFGPAIAAFAMRFAIIAIFSGFPRRLMGYIIRGKIDAGRMNTSTLAARVQERFTIRVAISD
jgi:hypothetical protein